MPGERLHPTSSAGIKGAKPRSRIAKLPPAEIEKASREYLVERNRMMRFRRQREELRLSIERNLLIERELVGKQLAFLLIELRAQLLTIPRRIGARLQARLRDVGAAREAAAEAKAIVYETLQSCADLPARATDPDWLKRVEEEE
jgi:hypothetical protein